jgi:hypothetical protein
MQAQADQEVRHTGGYAQVDQGGAAPLAISLTKGVLGEGEAALGLGVVHVRGQIHHMGVELEAQLQQGRVEAGHGGIHQQLGAGQPLQFRSAAVEERGEVGQGDEVDPLEQLFGVEQGIAG